MSLKTNYKDDKFAGKRIYKMDTLEGGLVTLEDQTQYQEEGDIFSAADINATNTAVNSNTAGLSQAEKMIAGLQDKIVVNLPVSGWSGTAPFTQTIPLLGIKNTDNPIPGMLYPDNLTDDRKAQIDKSSNMITEIETLDGSLKVTCQFKRPTADLILVLKGVSL